MISLLITTYNRSEYLQRCFETLEKVQFPKDSSLIIVDDHSSQETVDMINKFSLPDLNIIKRFKTQNLGIKDSLKIGFELGFRFSDIVINLDGDGIVKPDFITRLVELKEQFPNYIISGFNSKNKNRDGSLRNPIIKDFKGYSFKKYANGINMCINKNDYLTKIKPALFSEGNWDFNSTNTEEPVVVAVPSLVQHIGFQSSMGHSDDPDVACDYDVKSIHLPTVTLFGTDCRDVKGILRAGEICQRDIQFGEVKIITEQLYSGIEAYSKFYIKEVANYIDTDHALIFHADGYVQKPSAWKDEWLEYDYIGATWGYKDNMNVGNGGFTLRSRKLLRILSEMNLDVYHPEDDIICRKLRPELEKKGIRFASEEVANNFSIEAYGASVFPKGSHYSGQFGFHGYHVQGLPIPPLPKVTDTPARTNVPQSVNHRRFRR